MSKERIYLFDTTLRDGQQTPGIDFSLADKIHIAKLLDKIGIDFVEGGYPGANPTDTSFFSEKRTSRASFVAFGMTKRAGRSVENDPGLQNLLNASSDAVCFVAKASEFHVRVALGCTNDENVETITSSVEACVSAGKMALLDCEHFFDGYKENPEYALECVKAAHASGARWIVLCDTNGGTLPQEIHAIVSEVCRHVPGDQLGIHAHDDTENAVANSLAAIDAGVRQVQGTINGVGERCGNANLVSLIPTLKLKKTYSDRFEIGITDESLKELVVFSRSFDELTNRSPNRQAPYVGESAFATKAGIHASAILKDPQTYEHIDPLLVGNKRRVMVSDQAGKSNLISELNRFGMQVEKSDRRLDALLADIKERESLGYAYEAADASLELLAHRKFGTLPNYFAIDSFKVLVERRTNTRDQLVTFSEAIVKVMINGERKMSVAEGNGPINALDQALRKDLGEYNQYIEDLELVDYKVRILNGGTEAITRVLIESRDGNGNHWFTVGVSSNIVDASFEALVDSVYFKLMKANVETK